MVTIRLSRSGSKKRPYYFISVADSRVSRDGRFIERLVSLTRLPVVRMKSCGWIWNALISGLAKARSPVIELPN